MAELLIELLSEEIPARMQDRAAADLKRLVCDGLKAAGLSFDHAEAYATPRRLTLMVDGLSKKQPDIEEDSEEKGKGLPVGAPNKAIQGFLGKLGLGEEQIEEAISRLEELDVGEWHEVTVTHAPDKVVDIKIRKQNLKKGLYYVYKRRQKGRQTSEILPIEIYIAINALEWPKSMRWAHTSMRWVRPLQNILAIFDGKPLAGGINTGHPDAFFPMTGYFEPHEVAKAQNTPNEKSITFPYTNFSFGHRFMAPDKITVTGFADYRDKLRSAYVMLDSAERRKVIEQDAALEAENEGLTLKPDPGLIAEVAGLVEWPVVLIGTIEAEFMDLPAEVLTTSMRHHLKHFALLDSDGRLAPRFIVVANIHATDGGKQIVAGNETVLRARLADAKFFWDQDIARSLESRIPNLDVLVFHAKLGSVGEKVTRIEALAVEIAKFIPGADEAQVREAARLCKTDLVTGMVGEFPELQGVMGRYYALAEGKSEIVADAIADHYAPKGPNDTCPTAPVSIAVALADKIDSLVGFWAIDEKPTGSKDPFALRRAAQGVIRLIVENKIRLHLFSLFKIDDAEGLLGFFVDRLKVHLKEQGVRHDLITAVFALGDEDDLMRLLKRVRALQDFIASEDGEHLLVAYRRAANIVRIEEKRDGAVYVGGKNFQYPGQEKAEKALIARLTEVSALAAKARLNEEFTIAMSALARLRKPVDDFFDQVMVNVDDKELRINRLNLLCDIRVELDQFADFSKIEG